MVGKDYCLRPLEGEGEAAVPGTIPSRTAVSPVWDANGWGSAGGSSWAAALRGSRGNQLLLREGVKEEKKEENMIFLLDEALPSGPAKPRPGGVAEPRPAPLYPRGPAGVQEAAPRRGAKTGPAA